MGTDKFSTVGNYKTWAIKNGYLRKCKVKEIGDALTELNLTSIRVEEPSSEELIVFAETDALHELGFQS